MRASGFARLPFVKLGEALAEAHQLRGEIAQGRGHIAAIARYQEGDTPAEDARDLVGAVTEKIQRLQVLVARINRTNSSTEIAPGTTITDAIAQRDGLGAAREFLATAADAAAGGGDRMGLMVRHTRSELRLVTDLDVRSLRAEIGRLAKERRELDARLQALNWTADLLD